MATVEAPSDLKLTPLGDRVVVQPLGREETTKSGIVLPDTAKEKPQEAKVVALGTGGRDDDGKLIDFTVKVDDVVLISKYGGTEVKVDGEEHLILAENDILGIIQK